MLTVHGKFITVGIPEEPLPSIPAMVLVNNGCFFGGSHIGSKKEALSMLKLAADKGIKPWCVFFLYDQFVAQHFINIY